MYSESKSIVVTKEFLLKHRTINNAWISKQLSLLDVSWPPKKGWIKKVIGKKLSKEDSLLFSNYKNFYK
jgi:hypothetical protein